jgi:hypothetical protein
MMWSWALVPSSGLLWKVAEILEPGSKTWKSWWVQLHGGRWMERAGEMGSSDPCSVSTMLQDKDSPVARRSDPCHANSSSVQDPGPRFWRKSNPILSDIEDGPSSLTGTLSPYASLGPRGSWHSEEGRNLVISASWSWFTLDLSVANTPPKTPFPKVEEGKIMEHEDHCQMASTPLSKPTTSTAISDSTDIDSRLITFHE